MRLIAAVLFTTSLFAQATGDEFTIVAVPDIHNDSGSSSFPTSSAWMISNKTSWNIVGVAGLGDNLGTTSGYTDSTNWDALFALWDPLHTAITNVCIAAGNHDAVSVGPPPDWTNWNTYLGARSSWWYAYSPTSAADTQHPLADLQYCRFDVVTSSGTYKMGIITLPIFPLTTEVATVHGWIAADPHRHFIIGTHMFVSMVPSGNTGQHPCIAGESLCNPGTGRVSGADMWNALKDLPNIFAFVSGHTHEQHSAVMTDGANPNVYAFSDVAIDGTGTLILLKFRPTAQKLDVSMVHTKSSFSYDTGWGGTGTVSYDWTPLSPGTAPTITTASLPSGAVGTAYSTVLAATGDATITWTATGLPGWATLDSDGTLHGTPNTATPATITFTAHNSAGDSTPVALGLTIAPSAVVGSVTVIELTGSTQTLRPFTISRVFKEGDIAAYAQPSVGGVAIAAWQCDVKSRWSDGSLKHALISFRYTVPSSGSITVGFSNSATPSSAGDATATAAAGLDGAGMLAFDDGGGASSWGAVTSAVISGVTHTADARAMLTAGKFSYWLRGPVVTQAIVEDRTSALTYDFGWTCATNCTGDYSTATWTNDGTYKSLHPIFVVTFYANWTGVKVEYILENAWSTKFQDQRYAVTLYSGSASGTTEMGATTFTQYAGTRWRQTFWDGTEPGVVKIDYNLPYMVASKALPSYDTTKVVSSTGINADLTRWAGTDKGALFGDYLGGGDHMSGNWIKNWETTGEDYAWGFVPTWVIRYLYTFHTTADGSDLYTITMKNAEVGGYMPYHYAEGDSSAGAFCGLSAQCTTDGVDTASGFARVLSRDLHTAGFSGTPTVLASLSSAHNWQIDTAHEPNIAYIPYLITGDKFYLDELNYLASWNLMQMPAGTTLLGQSHNDWGSTVGTTSSRAVAWILRTMAHAAFINPDATPEKSYFTQKLLNNIAIMEGRFDVEDGYGYTGDNTKWQWGYTRQSAVQGSVEQTTHIANPLNLFGVDWSSSTEGIDTSVTERVDSLWMVHYAKVMLAMIEDLGYPVTALRKKLAIPEIHIIKDPTFNPYLTASYRMPVFATATHSWFTTWAGLLSGFDSTRQTQSAWTAGSTNGGEGYPFIARATAQFMEDVDVPSLSCTPTCGVQARMWMNNNVPNQSQLNDNPKWAFVPRNPVTLGGISLGGRMSAGGRR